MNNKEFVEELVSSLNEISTDPVRFKRINEFRYKQKFVLIENIYKEELKSGESKFTVQVDLVLDSGNKKEVIIKNRFTPNPIKEKSIPKQLLNDIYRQVKLSILRYTLFAKEYVGIVGDGEGTQAVCIPIRQIIVEGYDNAKKRIINEFK